MSVTEHVSGRTIGGISGIAFLILVLLPVGQGSKPIFFAIFELFKVGGKVRGGGPIILMGAALVLVFLAYIFAALIALTNIGVRPSAEQTASNASKLVFFASLAVPASFLLVAIVTGRGLMTAITLIIKFTLLFGGIIGMVAVGSLDLVDQFLPQTMKGSDLLKKTQGQNQDRQPPNIWNG